jgi:hypothetical protein
VNSKPNFSRSDFLLRVMVYGFKGIRYLVSPGYRVRVRGYWVNHPGSSSHDIPRMISGAMIDVGIVGLIVVVLLLRWDAV